MTTTNKRNTQNITIRFTKDFSRMSYRVLLVRICTWLSTGPMYNKYRNKYYSVVVSYKLVNRNFSVWDVDGFWNLMSFCWMYW